MGCLLSIEVNPRTVSIYKYIDLKPLNENDLFIHRRKSKKMSNGSIYCLDNSPSSKLDHSKI